MLTVDFNQLFTRFSEWTGGDATYSVPLPDGRVLWMFGDSFIGTVATVRYFGLTDDGIPRFPVTLTFPSDRTSGERREWKFWELWL